jgi:quercetin dioxygenase-like cupin family protein
VQHVVEGRTAPVHRIVAGKGTARLLLNAATGASAAALTHLTFAAGAEVPEHVHAESAELLYVEEGVLEMTIAGRPATARGGDAVYIPAGTPHATRATRATRAVQLYVGPGPEQRFRQGERVPPGAPPQER